MWKPYDTVCTALLPNADVTVDWFHVIQTVNKELKQLKNQEKKAQPEAFKGAHYALLKNQQDLTDKQATALEQVYRACPPVKMAHRLKECLRRIFESHATKDLAQKRLDKWRQIAEQEKLFAPPVVLSMASTTRLNSSNVVPLDSETLSIFASESWQRLFSKIYTHT